MKNYGNHYPATSPDPPICLGDIEAATQRALNGLQIVASRLLDNISRKRRAGRSTANLEAALDRIYEKARSANTEHLKVARQIYLKGGLPRYANTPVFENFHTTKFRRKNNNE